jgi:hypothetical protein
MNQVLSVVGRILFAGAFLLAGLAVWEKVANLMGLTLVRIYTPARLLDFAVIAVFFVIALELREIRQQAKGSTNF